MYDIFDNMFFIPERELKEKVHKYLKKLQIFEPEQWSDDFIASVDPNKSTSDILEVLANISLVEKIKPLFEKWSHETILRNIAYTLCVRVESLELRGLYLRHFYKIKRRHFIILRYLLVTDILTKQQGKTPITKNPTAIQQMILEGFKKDGDAALSIIAEAEAINEIQAFYSDETNKEYIEKISKLELAIYDYIKQYAYIFCGEAVVRAIFESLSKNSDIFDQIVDFEDKITEKDKRESINDWLKVSSQLAKERMDLKDGRGGSREKKGFVWRDENKIELYKTVENLSKISGKPMWQYAFDELND